jgi:hypothetical protein
MLGSWLILRWALKQMDPNHNARALAKLRKKELAKRLGRPINLDGQYEDVSRCCRTAVAAAQSDDVWHGQRCGRECTSRCLLLAGYKCRTDESQFLPSSLHVRPLTLHFIHCHLHSRLTLPPAPQTLYLPSAVRCRLWRRL